MSSQLTNEHPPVAVANSLRSPKVGVALSAHSVKFGVDRFDHFEQLITDEWRQFRGPDHSAPSASGQIGRRSAARCSHLGTKRVAFDAAIDAR